MDPFVDMEAIKTYTRLKVYLDTLWCGMFKPRHKSHLHYVKTKTRKIEHLNLDNRDEIISTRVTTRNFKIDQKSFQSGGDIDTNTLKCYTDGSKMGNMCGLMNQNDITSSTQSQ